MDDHHDAGMTPWIILFYVVILVVAVAVIGGIALLIKDVIEEIMA